MQDEEGDGGDGTIAGSQDWTSLPVVPGDGADEDSSDGDEVLLLEGGGGMIYSPCIFRRYHVRCFCPSCTWMHFKNTL